MSPRGVAPVALALSLIATSMGVRAGTRDEGHAAMLLAQRGGGRRGGGGVTAGDISVGRVLTRGEVQTIDHATRHVEIKTEGGVLDAAFTPQRIGELKPRDVVFVTVNLIDPRIAAVSATVTAVDRGQGTMTVATPRGPLTLRPSAAALTKVDVGAPLLLKLELVDVGPSFDSGTKD